MIVRASATQDGAHRRRLFCWLGDNDRLVQLVCFDDAMSAPRCRFEAAVPTMQQVALRARRGSARTSMNVEFAVASNVDRERLDSHRIEYRDDYGRPYRHAYGDDDEGSD